MAKPFVPWSKEKCERFKARNERLRQMTDRCLYAGIEAAQKGEDIGAAVDAAAAACKRPPEPGSPDEIDLAPLLETRRIRVDGWTVAMQRDFIRTLADTGSVTHAAKAVGVARSTAYAMRHQAGHTTFALAWDVAIQLGRKRLLDVAMERALEGQEVPVWYRGEQVGTRRVYNDRLLTFLIGHTPAPAHPQLTPLELAAMYPLMLKSIDTLMPHPLAVRVTAERAAAKAAAGDVEDEDDF